MWQEVIGHGRQKKVPKTTGVDWLGYSLAAFNGSGYADRHSPLAFARSYREYKRMKNKPEAVALVNENWELAKEVAKGLIEGPAPSKTISKENEAKFLRFYKYE